MLFQTLGRQFRVEIFTSTIYTPSIPIDRSHYAHLYDLDLLNKLFTYNYKLKKINDDIETLTNGYNDMKNALIEKNISRQDYVTNMKMLADQLVVIETFLIDLQMQTVNLLARIRLHIKHDKPLGLKLQHFFLGTKGNKINKTELDQEIAELNQEVAKNKQESQKEIEAVLSKHKSES